MVINKFITVNPQKAEVKLSKESLTVLFCVNKNCNPQWFKSIIINSLPVDYRNYANASMTYKKIYDLFHSLIVLVMLREQNLESKDVNFLDDCSAYPLANNLISNDFKIRH